MLVLSESACYPSVNTPSVSWMVDTIELTMHAVRDRSDQHSVFFVVWPEEKSTETQATLPSLQHPKEQNFPQMETAASIGSSHDAISSSRDASTSQRLTGSVSPPIDSPDSDHQTSKQAAISSPATADPSKQFSPVQPLRAALGQTLGHQMITLPSPAIVSMPESQQVLLAEQQGSKEVYSNHLQEQKLGDHSILLSPAHKHLLQMGGPLLATAPSVPRGQDLESFRKIGQLAEQAALNLQKILQTTHKYQSVSKQANQNSLESEQNSDSNFLQSPSPKRFCTLENTPTNHCLECEVKIAEIHILRKKINSLQEQVNLFNSRSDRIFPSPLLTSASIDSSRIQQSNVKAERPRLPLHTPTLHTELLPSDTLVFNHRGRKSLDKHSPVSLNTSSSDNQSVASGNELTELVSGSGVYVLTRLLMEARKEARSGTQLARKLMDVFWDKDTLAKSTLTPRSKFQYQQLDPKTIKAIEVYCLQYDATVHSKDIHATMTDKCCQARSRIRTQNSEPIIEPKPHNTLYSIHS